MCCDQKLYLEFLESLNQVPRYVFSTISVCFVVPYLGQKLLLSSSQVYVVLLASLVLTMISEIWGHFGCRSFFFPNMLMHVIVRTILVFLGLSASIGFSTIHLWSFDAKFNGGGWIDTACAAVFYGIALSLHSIYSRPGSDVIVPYGIFIVCYHMLVPFFSVGIGLLFANFLFLSFDKLWCVFAASGLVSLAIVLMGLPVCSRYLTFSTNSATIAYQFPKTKSEEDEKCTICPRFHVNLREFRGTHYQYIWLLWISILTFGISIGSLAFFASDWYAQGIPILSGTEFNITSYDMSTGIHAFSGFWGTAYIGAPLLFLISYFLRDLVHGDCPFWASNTCGLVLSVSGLMIILFGGKNAWTIVGLCLLGFYQNWNFDFYHHFSNLFDIEKHRVEINSRITWLNLYVLSLIKRLGQIIGVGLLLAASLLGTWFRAYLPWIFMGLAGISLVLFVIFTILSRCGQDLPSSRVGHKDGEETVESRPPLIRFRTSKKLR